MNTELPEDAEPWQREAWSHMAKLLGQFDQFDQGYFPRAYSRDATPDPLPTVIGNVVWGRCPVDVDVDEFERAILHARDEYRRRLGVDPTVIDLPNWTRGTILEQIAFTNGFTIADPRKE